MRSLDFRSPLLISAAGLRLQAASASTSIIHWNLWRNWQCCIVGDVSSGFGNNCQLWVWQYYGSVIELHCAIFSVNQLQQMFLGFICEVLLQSETSNMGQIILLISEYISHYSIHLMLNTPEKKTHHHNWLGWREKQIMRHKWHW